MICQASLRRNGALLILFEIYLISYVITISVQSHVLDATGERNTATYCRRLESNFIIKLAQEAITGLSINLTLCNRCLTKAYYSYNEQDPFVAHAPCQSMVNTVRILTGGRNTP